MSAIIYQPYGRLETLDILEDCTLNQSHWGARLKCFPIKNNIVITLPSNFYDTFFCIVEHSDLSNYVTWVVDEDAKYEGTSNFISQSKGSATLSYSLQENQWTAHGLLGNDSILNNDDVNFTKGSTNDRYCLAYFDDIKELTLVHPVPRLTTTLKMVNVNTTMEDYGKLILLDNITTPRTISLQSIGISKGWRSIYYSLGTNPININILNEEKLVTGENAENPLVVTGLRKWIEIFYLGNEFPEQGEWLVRIGGE